MPPLEALCDTLRRLGEPAGPRTLVDLACENHGIDRAEAWEALHRGVRSGAIPLLDDRRLGFRTVLRPAA